MPQKSPAAPPPRARLSSAARRREIVAAVLDLARERGPDAITTHAIAERVGVTQGAVFRHFPDKAAIWIAVFAWVRGELVRAFEAAVDEAASPLTNIERVFFAHVALVSANPGVPRVLFHELQSAGDSAVRGAVRAAIGDYRRRLARLFEQAIEAGEIPRSLDTALAPVLFIGAVQGLVIHATLTGDDSVPARTARQMFALLLDGYRGGTSTRKRDRRA
jgi:TetR/AcrR family transcriptional regulator